MGNFELGLYREIPLPVEREVRADWGPDGARPLVSVICNTYNHRELIDDALRGFLLQRTTFPFEVIVHDDASTDGTSDIVMEYAARYPGIIRHILQRDNQFSRGRKPTAISSTYALGEYLAFCEGDDFWIDRGKLQSQADFLLANPRFSACSTWSLVLEGNVASGTECSSRRVVSHVDILLGSKEQCRMGTLMIRRAALPVKLPDEMNAANAGDNFLRILASRHGPIRVLPGFSSCYRIHHGGVWSQLGVVERKRKVLHDLQLLRKVVEPEYQAYVDCRIAWHALATTGGMTMGRRVLHLATLLRHPFILLRLTWRQAGRVMAKLRARGTLGLAAWRNGATGWR